MGVLGAGVRSGSERAALHSEGSIRSSRRRGFGDRRNSGPPARGTRLLARRAERGANPSIRAPPAVVRYLRVIPSRSSQERAPDPLHGLLPRIAEGDQAALRSLFDATRRRTFGTLLRMLGEREEAEDVLVDVYTHVWKRAGHYDPERGSPGLWLFTIARSRAIDRLRSRGVHGAERLDDLDELIAGDPTPREAAETQERAARVRAALLSLPEEQRRAVVAAFFLGQTHTEIARRSGEPLGTVKSRIRAALARLRDALARRTPTHTHSAEPAADRNGEA